MDWLVSVEGPTGLRLSRSFLVDTGATRSLIPIEEARRLRLPLRRWSDITTAKGMPYRVPVVGAMVSVEGCGYFSAEFYGISGRIFAVGNDIIQRCGLTIPARG